MLTATSPTSSARTSIQPETAGEPVFIGMSAYRPLSASKTTTTITPGLLGGRVVSSRAWVQIAAATLSGNSLRQTVHTHRASVRQAAKLVAALLRVARVTAGLAESNGSLPPGL